MNKILLLLPFFFLCTAVHGQEICDNGIDDDNDGLIDLNDSDCECYFEFDSELIPNSSFEEMTCCPDGEADLPCAVSWEQASGPTTEYVHTCGVLGNPFVGKDAPLPFPDGEGGIGFRDGRPGNPNYKEYAGSILNAPMEAGKLYQMDFFVGFPDDPFSEELDISLYATDMENALPFGNNNNNIGCPTNVPGWDLIERQTVNGRDEWVNVVFDFVANKPYTYIVLGPSCEPHPLFDDNPYFFFDRLFLAERVELDVPFSFITGSVCAEGLSLTVNIPEATSYQWFLNGQALPNTTGATILLSEFVNPEGEYKVVAETVDGCLLSEAYEMIIPYYEEMVEVSICRGDSLTFADQVLTEENMYENLFIASDGCDSMVYLDLQILEHSIASRADFICEGDVLELDGFEFSEPGDFEYTISNVVGCDSLVAIDLTLIPANEGLELMEDIELKLGEEVAISPSFVDPSIEQFSWVDQNGNVVSSQENIVGFRPIEDTTLKLIGTDAYGCISMDTMELRVFKQPNAYSFIPNVFTPDDQSINNTFQIFGSLAVVQLAEVRVYNRWGELVYLDENVGPLANYLGWDGRYKGVKAPPGVYAYVIKLDILDGTQEIYSGDVTLLR